jgi:hypothetical protein
VAEAPTGGVGLYARVSSHDQRADLDRQVARLSQWAAQTDAPVVRVEAVGCAQRDVGPAAFVGADGQDVVRGSTSSAAPDR